VHWLVIGCGYTGTRLARTLLALGEPVTITRRDAAEAARLAGELTAEVGSPTGSARTAGPARDVSGIGLTLGAPIDIASESIVVCLAPPGEDPASEIRTLLPARRLVYVGSTGVYAPAHGNWVDESWPLEPTTASGHTRLVAERAASEHPSSIVLRVAGIHGPGRGTEDRIRAGTYRIIGDGTSHVSRIHVDDLVTAIVAAGTSTITGPVNIADDDPAPIGEVADAIAARLQLPPPPRVDPSTVSPEIAGMLTANRRISNARMKRELGVVLRYPSWASVGDGGRA
jgi:hypothetical protein